MDPVHTSRDTPTPLSVTLAFNCIDGCYLPKHENDFVHTVQDELDEFLQKREEKSVLLFPALPSRLRYLIHKTAESYPSLGTFSVGEGWSRRVVACYAHLRLPEEEVAVDLHEQAQDQVSKVDEGKGCPTPEPQHARSKATRRPDKAIYVPRAIRDKSAQAPAAPQAQMTLSDSAVLQEPCADAGVVCEAQSLPGTNQEAVPDSSDALTGKQVTSDLPADLTCCALPPDWDQTVSLFMDMSVDSQGQEVVVSTASKLPAGGAVDFEDFTQEIFANLTEVDVTIERTHNDYSCYASVWFSPDDFSHVIEIYDFPAIFKTEDLLDAFADFSKGGLKIKWVDDTHALGVFSSKSAAQQALCMEHPQLKVRSLSEGSKKAKGKALRRAEFIQPVKERPRTDTAVARRLVTRALGLQRRGRGHRGKRC